MSPSRASRSKSRAAYKPPRDRRELYTALAVALVIVLVTATFVWFLRPNRGSSGDSTPVTPPPVTVPTDTTPADTTPADTTPDDTTPVPEDTGTAPEPS